MEVFARSSTLAGGLDSTYFINGDAAYVLSPQMVVSTGKAKTTNFDYVQSANRVCIECAFGVRILLLPISI